MSNEIPNIFLLSVETDDWFDESYASLIATISSRAAIQRAKNPAAALRHLTSNTPSAILVTDAYLTTSSASPELLAAVVQYIRNGGTVIIMGLFASFVKPQDMDKFFLQHFGLNWKGGDYHRTDVILNNHGPARANRKGLMESYSLKAVFLRGVERGDSVYLPPGGARVQSHVFAAEKIQDLKQTPVAMTAVGKGCLGYVGDVNGEAGSEKIVVAMCGL